MKNILYRLLISSVLSLAVLVLVAFFVAWLFEGFIYFSLFVGIPCGIVAALAVFSVVFHYLKD